MFANLSLKSYFIVDEVFLITVKIILSFWTGRWLDPLWVWKAKKFENLPAAPLAGWQCKMSLIVANICPKITLELTAQPSFPEGASEREGTLFSDLRKLTGFILTFYEGAEQRAARGLC